MGTLKVDRLDFNEIGMLEAFGTAIEEIAGRPDSYRELRFKPPHYFEVSGSQLPDVPGWYIILDGTQPLYVGKTDNLDARLNTDNGSRDDFGNSTRSSDAQRNFIKKFIEIGVFQSPRVCVIRMSDLAAAIGVSERCITKTDVGNIEKVINLIRNGITYL